MHKEKLRNTKLGQQKKGYAQVERIDFGEIFSLVSKLTSIIFLLFVAAAFYFEVEQMDVKTAFLCGDLEEEIYMKQPKGFVVKGNKELVCRMKKSLYGLKKSLRMWYKKFDTYILRLGFTRIKSNYYVYCWITERGGESIIEQFNHFSP